MSCAVCFQVFLKESLARDIISYQFSVNFRSQFFFFSFRKTRSSIWIFSLPPLFCRGDHAISRSRGSITKVGTLSRGDSSDRVVLFFSPSIRFSFFFSLSLSLLFFSFYLSLVPCFVTFAFRKAIRFRFEEISRIRLLSRKKQNFSHTRNYLSALKLFLETYFYLGDSNRFHD